MKQINEIKKDMEKVERKLDFMLGKGERRV